MTKSSYEITWLPAEWQDEFIPETMRHPNDFIRKCNDGSYIVIPKKSKDDLSPDGDLEDQEHLLFKLQIGDLVHFQQTEQYGTFTLHIDEERTLRVEGEYPVKANTFHLPEAGTIGDSIDDTVRQAAEVGGQLAPGQYDIDIYWRGDGIEYRFDISPEGTPHFIEVGPLQ